MVPPALMRLARIFGINIRRYRKERGLSQEALNTTGATYQDTIFGRQFFDTENSDDVLQVLIALQHTLNFASGGVVGSHPFGDAHDVADDGEISLVEPVSQVGWDLVGHWPPNPVA